MRTGAQTVQQALTTEAASVLKHSLNLAKRRGHAQVTPLHVAATLLSSSREASTMFRRACLKSHPLHPNSHPLHCRALELCFNVALNRLPTVPPPSSGPLIPTQPSLSNALIAALKRAQAHQRRGSIEQQQLQQQQQQHQNQQHQNQQNQQLLAIKVELEQLIISILDDPSVSRVMREAGFSSTCVKNNLEDSSFVPPSFFFDAPREILSHPSFWPPFAAKAPFGVETSVRPLVHPSQNEDLMTILDVLAGKKSSSNKNGRSRTGVVVVGDSVSYSEALLSELMGRVERGDGCVPEELRSAQVIRFHLSPFQLKFMGRGDVEMKVSDLRRKVCTLTSERRGAIIYLGDLKWAAAADAEQPAKDHASGFGSYSAGDHVIAEVARLQSEWRSGYHSMGCGVKVWMLATASYQTHLSCQKKQPPLEIQWDLQAIDVPSGGLALTLHHQAPSFQNPRATILTKGPIQTVESKPFSSTEEKPLTCCPDCTLKFEREASKLKVGNRSDTNLPHWLQPQVYNSSLSEDVLVELRRKWSRLCHSLNHGLASHSHHHLYPPLNYPTWSLRRSMSVEASAFNHAHHTASTTFSELAYKSSPASSSFLTQLRSWNENLQEKGVVDLMSLQNRAGNNRESSRTVLTLSSTPFSDSATSKDHRKRMYAEPQELSQRLKESIPWQSDAVSSIVEAVVDQKASRKGVWLLLKGSDRIGKRRLVHSIAKFFTGSVNNLIEINARRYADGTRQVVDVAKQGTCCVIFIQDVNHAEASFLDFLQEGFKTGFIKDEGTGRLISLADVLFVSTTSTSESTEDASLGVISLKLQVEDAADDGCATTSNKRKCGPELLDDRKRPRNKEDVLVLDLNICVDEHDGGEEENIPSDLTHEMGAGEMCSSSNRLLTSLDACFVLDVCEDRPHPVSKYYVDKLNQSFKEVLGCSEGSCLHVDDAVLEKLTGASEFIADNLFIKWTREVFQACLAKAKRGGNMRLSLDGEERLSECGFEESTLPNNIRVGEAQRAIL